MAKLVEVVLVWSIIFFFSPVIEGAEELSPDDTVQSPGVTSSLAASANPVKTVIPRPKPSAHRPKILNKKRHDRNQPEDWSERCVDVFDILAQIGEGTYGQVYKARAKDKKSEYVCLLR